jgi:iron complex outermembrane recepter protein
MSAMGVVAYSCRIAVAGILTVIAITHGVAQELEPIDTVTVWAQKRPTELQDLPMTVSTLTAKDLAAGGISDLHGTAVRLPAFDLQSSVTTVTTTLRIRRVGNLGNIPTFEPAVGLFVDGAFRSRSMLGTADLLDIERIEVLSGPQSTLYGKNASAGVVAIYTKAPGERFTAAGELSGGWIDTAGTPGSGRLSVALSGPLSSTWGAGLAAAHSEHGHTLSNALREGADGNEQSRSTVRGQLSWSPNDQLKLRLIAGYVDIADDEGESDVYLAPGARSTAVAESLRQQGFAPACPDNAPHNRTTCSVATNHLDLEAYDLTLIGEYELKNGWMLTSITGWDRYRNRRDEDDVMQLFAPLMYFHDSEEGTTLQEELRLTSAPTARMPWLAGLFYYENEYDRGTRGKRAMFGPNGAAAFDPVWQTVFGVPLALPGQEGFLDSRLDTDYLGAFGQLTWNINKQLALTTGVRWQREDKHASMNNTVSQPGASVISRVLTPSASPTGEPINGAAKRTLDVWTWSLTPQFRVNDDLMVYASLVRGAKSGGFNTGFGNAALTAREFDDERIDNYELGSRVSMANGRGRMSAAVFYTRYDNYQDAAFISAQFTVGNAGRADLKGAEIEGSWQFGSRTVADFAISYADLVYARNTTGMCYPGREPDGSLPRSCDLSGEHPIDAPQWAAHLGLEHTAPLGATDLFGRVDWSWSDQYSTSFSGDPRLIQKPFHDVGVRLGVRTGGNYEVVLSVENLLNEKIVHLDPVLNFFNDASYQSFLDDARRYNITVRAQF